MQLLPSLLLFFFLSIFMFPLLFVSNFLLDLVQRKGAIDSLMHKTFNGVAANVCIYTKHDHTKMKHADVLHVTKSSCYKETLVCMGSIVKSRARNMT